MANAPSPTTSVRDGGACEPGTAASVLMVLYYFAEYISCCVVKLLQRFGKEIISDSRTIT